MSEPMEPGEEATAKSTEESPDDDNEWTLSLSKITKQNEKKRKKAELKAALEAPAKKGLEQTRDKIASLLWTSIREERERENEMDIQIETEGKVEADIQVEMAEDMATVADEAKSESAFEESSEASVASLLWKSIRKEEGHEEGVKSPVELDAKVVAEVDTKVDSEVPGTAPATSYDAVAAAPRPVASVLKGAQKARMSRTANDAVTFTSSDDPRVDFFFHVSEKTEEDLTRKLLDASWTDHANDSLKLMAQLRDIRHGKGIRSQYAVCMYWLYVNHEKTLHKNLRELVTFGYWKDALHLLMVIAFEGHVPDYLQKDDSAKVKKGKGKMSGKEPSNSKKRKASRLRGLTYNQRIIDSFAEELGRKEKVSDFDKYATRGLRFRYALNRLENDLKYRRLFLRVAKLFAEQLLADKQELEKHEQHKLKGKTTKVEGEVKVEKKRGSISLAGKWAPSLDGHFDRYLSISTAISIYLVLESKREHIVDKPLGVATCLSRKAFHKEYCVPLRKYHKVPEVFMSRGQWDRVDYSRVPAKCMTKNKAFFLKHDEARLQAYLEGMTNKVAGASLKPVQVIASVLNTDDPTESAIAEKQWTTLVEDIKKKGGCALFENALAICDVSGSMTANNCEPLHAALGLSLVTTSLSQFPWDRLVVSFSAEPEFHSIRTEDTLRQKLDAMVAMKWGYNTNIDAVFQLILSMGKEKNLTPEEMPKLLFIFSDMEFDEATSGHETNFEVASKSFEATGYKLPAIAFWNLRSSPETTSTPIRMNQNNVLLLSGFSGQQLSFVMKQKDFENVSPLSFVLSFINRDIYDRLEVCPGD